MSETIVSSDAQLVANVEEFRAALKAAKARDIRTFRCLTDSHKESEKFIKGLMIFIIIFDKVMRYSRRLGLVNRIGKFVCYMEDDPKVAERIILQLKLLYPHQLGSLDTSKLIL